MYVFTPILKIRIKLFQNNKNTCTFAVQFLAGTIAQLVEQRTENPCVAGSIPAGTTIKSFRILRLFLFHHAHFNHVCTPFFMDGHACSIYHPISNTYYPLIFKCFLNFFHCIISTLKLIIIKSSNTPNQT